MSRRSRVNPTLRQHALKQRRSPTPSEKHLWQYLRDHQLCGLKFRRQHIFEPFILDFYCIDHKLAVEVDGDIHDVGAVKVYDGSRQYKLESWGVRFLRFSAERVMTDIDGVLKEIAAACGEEL